MNSCTCHSRDSGKQLRSRFGTVLMNNPNQNSVDAMLKHNWIFCTTHHRIDWTLEVLAVYRLINGSKLIFAATSSSGSYLHNIQELCVDNFYLSHVHENIRVRVVMFVSPIPLLIPYYIQYLAWFELLFVCCCCCVCVCVVTHRNRISYSTICTWKYALIITVLAPPTSTPPTSPHSYVGAETYARYTTRIQIQAKNMRSLRSPHIMLMLAHVSERKCVWERERES